MANRHDDLLDRYLRASRRTRPWIGEGVEALAALTLETAGIAKPVSVIYSSAFHSALVTIDSQDRVLLDMNQIRVLHWMHTLYLADSQGDEFAILCARLIAQKLCNSGQLREARAYFDSATSGKSVLNAIEKAGRIQSIYQLSVPAQQYALMHEASHAIDDPTMRERCTAFLLEMYEFRLSEALLRAPDRANDLREVIARINSSPSLQEELFADWTARMHVFSEHPENVPFEEVALSVVLTHCHLLTLERLDRHVSSVRANYAPTPPVNSWSGDLDIRRDAAIWGVRTHAAMMNGNEARPVARLHDAMLDAVKRHDRIFDRVVDDVIVPSLQRVFGPRSSVASPDDGDNSDEVIAAFLDSEMGWTGAPVDQEEFVALEY